MHNSFVSVRRAVAALTSILTLCVAVPAVAQNINNGALLYKTPLVQGNPSKCSDGACHGPNPANNQNRIQLAADDPGRIGLAISQVAQMAFLRNNVNGTQLADLAAYIGNPGGATGAPAIELSTTALSFPLTNLGASATAQPIGVDNGGTAVLTISSVASSSPDFPIVSSNCTSVAVNAGCTVMVGFAPTVGGARSGVITINHNDSAAGGVSTIAVSGQAGSPAGTLTPATLAFGSVVVGLSSISQAATLKNTGVGGLLLGSISTSRSDFIVNGGTCTAGTTLASNATCTVSLRFAPENLGSRSGTLTVAHNGSGGGSTIALNGTGVSTAPTTRTMVEYLFAPLNYYFMTSRDSDKITLDGIDGFQRTGLSFPVYIAEQPGSKGISRYYFDKIALNGARGTHFYTLLESEKSLLVSLNPGNTQAPRLPFDEGIDSYAFLPEVEGVGGRCSNGLTPVYRVFRGNARFPDDPNHRFTSSVTVYNELVAAGWDNEGVKFCVPAQ